MSFFSLSVVVVVVFLDLDLDFQNGKKKNSNSPQLSPLRLELLHDLQERVVDPPVPGEPRLDLPEVGEGVVGREALGGGPRGGGGRGAAVGIR